MQTNTLGGGRRTLPRFLVVYYPEKFHLSWLIWKSHSNKRILTASQKPTGIIFTINALKQNEVANSDTMECIFYVLRRRGILEKRIAVIKLNQRRRMSRVASRKNLRGIRSPMLQVWMWSMKLFFSSSAAFSILPWLGNMQDFNGSWHSPSKTSIKLTASACFHTELWNPANWFWVWIRAKFEQRETV